MFVLSRGLSFSALTTEHIVIGHIFSQMVLMKFVEAYNSLFLNKMLYEAYFQGVIWIHQDNQVVSNMKHIQILHT